MNFSIFKTHTPKPIGVHAEYGLIIPLVKLENTWHVLYEKRALTLRRQPGEICFPGGKVERGETPREAAIRECSEELGISKQNIELIGPMDYMITPFQDMLIPFVARLNINNLEQLNINKDEVDSIITIPLDDLKYCPIIEHTVKTYVNIEDDFPFDKIQGGKNYNWKVGAYHVYFYEYNHITIWGMTAKLTKHFLTLICDKK